MRIIKRIQTLGTEVSEHPYTDETAKQVINLLVEEVNNLKDKVLQLQKTKQKKEIRMGGGSRKCPNCGETTFGSVIHRCKAK